MKGIYCLSAEVFGYSYEYYEEKMESGHLRFTYVMPNLVRALHKNDMGYLSDLDLERQVNMQMSSLDILKKNYEKGKKMLCAEHAAASFMIAMKDMVKSAVEENRFKEQEIDNLVGIIGYNLANLGYMLDQENRSLKDYSDYFRQEKYL